MLYLYFLTQFYFQEKFSSLRVGMCISITQNSTLVYDSFDLQNIIFIWFNSTIMASFLPWVSGKLELKASSNLNIY